MALDFDGTDDMVNCGSAAILDNLSQGTFTTMAWFDLQTAGDSIYPRIVGKTPAGTADGWQIYIASNKDLVFQQGTTSASGIWYTNYESVQFGTLYHMAVTMNGASLSNDPAFYLDGVPVTVNVYQRPTGTLDSDAGNDFCIGNRANIDRSFDGPIWDARLYNRILRADEVLSIFTARGKDANVNGMVGRWLMRGRGGAVPTTIADLSVNGNTGTVIGSPNLVTDLLGARSG